MTLIAVDSGQKHAVWDRKQLHLSPEHVHAICAFDWSCPSHTAFHRSAVAKAKVSSPAGPTSSKRICIFDLLWLEREQSTLAR